MADWRPYTGTQRLQVGVTVLAAGVVAGVVFGPLPVAVSEVAAVGAVSGLWLVTLVALGFRERRHWSALVEQSSFERRGGTRSADVEKILGGRAVTVTTNVPGLFAQTHTEIRTPVEGVDAEFTIRISYVDSGGADDGVTPGTETLDERFVVEGSEQNVSRILSTDVQAALLDLETPGTCTVTGDRVVYDVPFTRLGPDELETISDLVTTIVERVETVGRS